MDYILEDAISATVRYNSTQKLFIPKQRDIQCLQQNIYSFHCLTFGESLPYWIWKKSVQWFMECIENYIYDLI
jgi:hypothetical protein